MQSIPPSSATTFVDHTFVAHKVPTERDLHCWFAHQTDKRQIDAKITRNGKVVHLICAPGAIVPKNIVLEFNAFDHKRTEHVKDFGAEAGDLATISTQLCYTVNLTKPVDRENPATGVSRFIKSETPVDAYGKIKPHLRTHFLSYLERATGLADLVTGGADIAIVPEPMDMDRSGRHKVRLIGNIRITITAKVANPDVFNRLAGVAIGNRRSYGFGSVNCDLLEKVAAFMPETEEAFGA